MILLHYSCARALRGYYLPGNRTIFKGLMRINKAHRNFNMRTFEVWGCGRRFLLWGGFKCLLFEFSYFSKIYEVLTTVGSQRGT